ncbi:methionyl-tRNA formyltransferase [Chloroflexi bacterium TSY]|nr:methionyl-tRNA formyltransferase [Chloroflexi bacterium TSY]
MTIAPTRIVFMGTPEFAVPSLTALYEQSTIHHWEIVSVMTQPDRRAGRGKKMIASPVKQQAESFGLSLLQPTSLRKEPAVVETLQDLQPDLIVVAAYGLILPTSVLDIPAFGCINVHASLLPIYRGASPIHAAILSGVAETGVSIMLMDEGLDTGPVLAKIQQPILPDDTTPVLSERLATQGANLLVETLPKWLAGTLPPIPQSELPGAPSLCRIIKKSAGQIDWTHAASQIERMTRAYTPWPSAFTTWNNQPFKIIQATVIEGEAEPSMVVEIGGQIAIGTGNGLLILKTVQPAGKRAMDIQSFLNGAPRFVGGQLGKKG